MALEAAGRGRSRKKSLSLRQRVIRFAKPKEEIGLDAFQHVVLRGTEEEQELSWRAFGLLEALAGPYGEWLFLPSQVLSEPQVILDNCMVLRSYAREEKKVFKK